MRKVVAHKKYYDKSYLYDSIHTEDITITLPMQKQYMTPQSEHHLCQEDVHYPNVQNKKTTKVFKVGYFIHIS